MSNFLDFIQFDIKDKPTQFGVFHLVFLFIMIALSALVIIFRKKLSDKFIKNTFIIAGILFIVLEIYKQIVFWWDAKFITYPWYIFPWQFCSTPIYLTALCGFIKKGHLRDALLAFMATFGLFAGLSVMLLPDGVLCWWAGINVQTMILHGGMVVLGILIYATKQIDTSWKTFLKGLIVFGFFLVIALALNFAWPLLKSLLLFSH